MQIETGIENFMELSALQRNIKGRIGDLECWVRVEVDSHSQSGGHHYFGFIEKSADGTELARARGIIWRYNAGILSEFRSLTGKTLEAGMSVVVLVTVNYDARFGLSLVITDIDANYSLGQRELEKKETIRKLTESGMMDNQKNLALPFLPSKVAVISSADAAGFGDFLKHTETNRFGYRFDFTLFHSLMQGDGAPSSIVSRITEIEETGIYDLILIMRGGGAESDLFCYDDYLLCKAVAACEIPVLTAVGHERDFHIIDMVAMEHFKTPTALADFMVDWVRGIEEEYVLAPLDAISGSVMTRLVSADAELAGILSTIVFAVKSRLDACDHRVSLSEACIKASDPRALLNLGYVLAVGADGTLLKNAVSGNVGDEFSLRFRDGRWICSIKDIKKEK